MSIKQIPERHVAICDACKKEMSIPGKSRPSTWVDVMIYADAHDFQGAPVASNNTTLLLCARCGPRLITAMNTILDKLRAEGPVL